LGQIEVVKILVAAPAPYHEPEAIEMMSALSCYNVAIDDDVMSVQFYDRHHNFGEFRPETL
jgi:hypothetical protein